MKPKKAPRYTVIIQWSDEDDCYVVSLPEWGPSCKTHGDSYEEAARNAREVLELLMQPEPGWTPAKPEPRLFNYPGADVVNLPESPSVPNRARNARRKRQTA